MVNLFFSILIALFSFQAFSFTFQVSGIKRTIINTPIQIFENSIPLYQDNNPAFIAYFDKFKLESGLYYYYQQSLSRYVKDFKMDVYYYNVADHLFCKGETCDGVNVTVSCKVLFNFEVKEKMFYEIKENAL